jgi:hypothetical protein
MKRWISLSRVERRMLVSAASTQLALAAALRVLPFATVRRALALTTRRHERLNEHAAASLPLLQWAVDASARRLGAASSCLVRALTVQWLAGRRGIAVPVHIGVRRNAPFDAHAWIGEPSGDGAYTRLVSFEGRR